MSNTSSSKKKSVKDVVAVIIKQVNKHNYALGGRAADIVQKFANDLTLLLESITGSPFSDTVENILAAIEGREEYQVAPTTVPLTNEQKALLRVVLDEYLTIKGRFSNYSGSAHTVADKKALSDLGNDLCKKIGSISSISEAKTFQRQFKALVKKYPDILTMFEITDEWDSFQTSITSYDSVKTEKNTVTNNRRGKGPSTKKEIVDQVNNAVKIVETANNSDKFGGKVRSRGWLNDLVDNISDLYGQYKARQSKDDEATEKSK